MNNESVLTLVQIANSLVIGYIVFSFISAAIFLALAWKEYKDEQNNKGDR